MNKCNINSMKPFPWIHNNMTQNIRVLLSLPLLMIKKKHTDIAPQGIARSPCKTHNPSHWEAPYGRTHLSLLTKSCLELAQDQTLKKALDVSEFSLVRDHT